MNTRGEREERGASAVEYGLMVALVAAVLWASLMVLSTAFGDAMDEECSRVAGYGGTCY